MTGEYPASGMGESVADGPYAGIDPTDEVLVAQSQAFEAAAAHNLDGQIPVQLVEELRAEASRLASDANLELLISSAQQ